MGIGCGEGEAEIMANCNAGDEYIASQDMNEASLSEKRYGGLTPKKPLIAKDHARAFFDSADWALCKQGAISQKTSGTVESLRPKLQRTPHQQLPPRRPTCNSGRDNYVD